MLLKSFSVGLLRVEWIYGQAKLLRRTVNVRLMNIEGNCLGLGYFGIGKGCDFLG